MTDVPPSPKVGERLVMFGRTVKLKALLGMPPTVITTSPLIVPGGTVTLIEVSLQLVGVAAVPLNVTVLVPWVAPKLLPKMFVTAPIGAEGTEVIVAAGPTLKLTALEAVPPTVTTKLPVVAPTGTGTAI